MTSREIEAQEVAIFALKESMYGWTEGDWKMAPDRGYLITTDPDDYETEGIDYVILEQDTPFPAVAWRLSGQHRPDGDWQLGTIDEFVAAVIADAEDWLFYLRDMERQREWDRIAAEIEARSE